MCLYIKDGCNIEIAKKDIVTFKDVISWKKQGWEPTYRGCELYKYNKVLTARKYPYTPIDTIEHLKAISDVIIEEGFHLKVKKTHSCNKICIIPKGSEICYGINNNIVSLHIIVFKNRLSYLKYRLAKLFKRNVESPFSTFATVCERQNKG